MKTQHDLPITKRSRRARLHALLFSSAALGTTILTLGGTIEPKAPPFKGE